MCPRCSSHARPGGQETIREAITISKSLSKADECVPEHFPHKGSQEMGLCFALH